jgi:hypothetical protein
VLVTAYSIFVHSTSFEEGPRSLLSAVFSPKSAERAGPAKQKSIKLGTNFKFSPSPPFEWKAPMIDNPRKSRDFAGLLYLNGTAA